MIVRPHPGPQTRILSSPADIVICGGAGGGGKTFVLLMEGIRHAQNPQFGGVIFRRKAVQIMSQGGLFDEALKMYLPLNAKPVTSPYPKVTFPSGARMTFRHLNQERDVYDWQGPGVPYFGFDELTHFTEFQFNYMFSRNRSTCGVRPYIRATCNPDPDSWVLNWIEWWIGEDGYPIEERSGVLRWFIRDLDDQFVWADTREELLEKYPNNRPLSLTFIGSKLADNPTMLEKDPDYEAKLLALDSVTRARLHGGNWLVRPKAGEVFPDSCAKWLKPGERCNIITRIRRWDLAATDKPTADYTVGVLMGITDQGTFVVEDVIRVQKSAGEVRQLIERTAMMDGYDVHVGLPQDFGQAGVDQIYGFRLQLRDFLLEVDRETGSKVTRASTFAAQWQQGNVYLVQGSWNTEFVRELAAFPTKGIHDDQVDAAAGAFNFLNTQPTLPNYGGLVLGEERGLEGTFERFR